MNEASTHGSKKTDGVEIDALFGLMYFRGILLVNLHMTERLSLNDSHFVFGAIMSKSRIRFLKGHISLYIKLYCMLQNRRLEMVLIT